MNSPSLPSWSFWLMGLGLAGFVLLFLQMIRRNKGIRRSFYAWPYTPPCWWPSSRLPGVAAWGGCGKATWGRL